MAAKKYEEAEKKELKAEKLLASARKDEGMKKGGKVKAKKKKK